MGKYHYCKYCGHGVFPNSDICPNCKTFIIPGESIHDAEYYRNKSIEKYGIPNHATDILIEEEVQHNNLYNYKPNMGNATEEHEIRNKAIFAKSINSNQNQNVPKCPVCQSTNIQKISAAKRAVHGYAFGLFSKTARSQFECKSCGYKF